MVKKVKTFKESKYHWYRDILLIMLGCSIMAIGVNLFIIPHKIVPGGVFGLSIAVNSVINLSVGAIALLINIPLLIISAIALGSKTGIKTVAATIICPLFLDGFTYIFGNITFTDDILVSSLFGGGLIGLGISIVLYGNATTGGTDTIAKILNKYTGIDIAILLFIIDGLIIITGIIVFKDLSKVPYAIITIFVTSKVINGIMEGLKNKNVVSIVSEKHEIIRDFILQDLNRGGTYYITKGLFNNTRESKVIQSSLERSELNRLMKFLKQNDPDAFITVYKSSEVFGQGFNPIP